MSAAALLESLRSAGVSVTLDAADLRLGGTREALTDQLLGLVREHKAEIVKHLTIPRTYQLGRDYVADREDRFRVVESPPGFTEWACGELLERAAVVTSAGETFIVDDLAAMLGGQRFVVLGVAPEGWNVAASPREHGPRPPCRYPHHRDHDYGDVRAKRVICGDCWPRPDGEVRRHFVGTSGVRESPGVAS